MSSLLPISFACASIRAELSDLERKCYDVPVRAVAVRERLERVKALVGKIEEHAEVEKGPSNDVREEMRE